MVSTCMDDKSRNAQSAIVYRCNKNVVVWFVRVWTINLVMNKVRLYTGAIRMLLYGLYVYGR